MIDAGSRIGWLYPHVSRSNQRVVDDCEEMLCSELEEMSVRTTGAELRKLECVLTDDAAERTEDWTDIADEDCCEETSELREEITELFAREAADDDDETTRDSTELESCEGTEETCSAAEDFSATEDAISSAGISLPPGISSAWAISVLISFRSPS